MYFSGCFLVNSCYFDFSVFFEKIYDVDFDLLDEDDELSALLFDYESCSFYGLSTYNFVSSRSFLFIESLIVYRFLITSNYYTSSGVMLTISLPLLPTLEFERFNGPRIVLRGGVTHSRNGKRPSARTQAGRPDRVDTGRPAAND